MARALRQDGPWRRCGLSGQGVHPHAHGLRLHGARRHGRKDHGEREGPADDHTAGALHVLRGALPIYGFDDRAFFPEDAGWWCSGCYILGRSGRLSPADSETERLSGEPAPFLLGPAALIGCQPAKTSGSMCGKRVRRLPDEGGTILALMSVACGFCRVSGLTSGWWRTRRQHPEPVWAG